MPTPEKDFWKNQEINPWISPRYHKGTYILEEDYARLSCNGRIGTGADSIRANVLPQPYIGNPEAPIWILPMNPGYNDIDVYDMIKCSDGVKRGVLRSLTKKKKDRDRKRTVEIRIYTDDQIEALFPHFFTPGSENNLKKRQELMENQLSFKDPEFYVLNDAFKTIRTGDEIRNLRLPDGVRRLDKIKLGGYEWWNRYLFTQGICNKQKERLNNFFVLESFPYHSHEFGKTDPQEDSKAHFNFWKIMVEYALKNDKILLCRGDKIAQKVTEIANKCDIPLEQQAEKIFINAGWGENGFTAPNDFNVSPDKFIPFSGLRGNNPDIKKVLQSILIRKNLIAPDEQRSR